jgi:hypothetical protein
MLNEAIRPTSDAIEEAEVLRRVPVHRVLPHHDFLAQRRAGECARVHGQQVLVRRPLLAQGPQVPHGPCRIFFF